MRVISMLAGLCLLGKMAHCQGVPQLQISPTWGFLMPHHNDMKLLVDDHMRGIETAVNWQTDGSKDWHHAFNFPSWGFTANWLDLGSELLGHSISTCLTIDLPLDEKRRSGLHMGIGSGYLTKPFDANDNFQNGAIGSHLNAALLLDAYIYLWNNSNVQIRSSIGIRHFSNGAIRVPNKGLNIALAGIQVQWSNARNVLPNRVKIEALDRSLKWFGGVSGGLKSLPPSGGPFYGVVNVFSSVQKRINGKSSVGAEVGINHNNSLKSSAKEQGRTPKPNENLRAFLSAQYLLHFGDLSLRLQLGSYLFPTHKDDGLLFFRYHLVYETHLWQIFAGLKSHYARADNIELGFAYRLK